MHKIDIKLITYKNKKIRVNFQKLFGTAKYKNYMILIMMINYRI